MKAAKEEIQERLEVTTGGETMWNASLKSVWTNNVECDSIETEVIENVE